MSAYYPPHHNRLLDLEHHLQHKQPSAAAPRLRPRGQSVQGRQTYRQLMSDRVAPWEERQSERQSQAFSLQQQSRLGEPQSRRAQVRSGVNRAAATPRKSRPRNSDRSAESYRQLASQMGKYYNPGKPFAQRPQNNLPEIQTPIRREVVQEFTASMPPKRKQRSIPSPVDRPASPSTNPPREPKWKGLAMSIRQARLGITDAVPGAPADIYEESRKEKVDWAIDEALTIDLEFDAIDSDQSTAPVENANASFDEPSTRPSQNRTSGQNVPQERKSPENDRHDQPAPFADVPTAPVTIDVTPVDETSNEPNRAASTTTMFSQDLDMATAIQVEESSLEPAAEVERMRTDGRLDREGTSAAKMGNPDDAQEVERSIPAADLDSDSTSVKGRVLQFYQLACRPHIVKYFALFQRKIQKLKDTHGQD